MSYNITKFNPPRCMETWLRSVHRIVNRSMVKKVQTYYDILQVPQNCSSKDIHLAFVHLSKKYHPDAQGINSCAEDAEKFLQISEAYHTLSKPKLRDAYDEKIWAGAVPSCSEYSLKANIVRNTENRKPSNLNYETLLKPVILTSNSKCLVPLKRAVWDIEEFLTKNFLQIWLSAIVWQAVLLSEREIDHRNKQFETKKSVRQDARKNLYYWISDPLRTIRMASDGNLVLVKTMIRLPSKMIPYHQCASLRPWEINPEIDRNPGPYYGIKGIERISNKKIVCVLLVLAGFGGVFGYFSAKYSFNRQRLLERFVKASNHHESVRSDAKKYGNEEQLRRMLDRMLKSNK